MDTKDKPKAATKANARRLVERVGGNLWIDGDRGGAEAPLGHVWPCDDIHEIRFDLTDGAAYAWADLIDRVQYGDPVPCETQDCEWCPKEAQR